MPKGCECIQTSFFPNATTTTPSSAINKITNGLLSFPPFFSQAWYSSRTCFTKPENISTTAEVRPKHVVLTTRGGRIGGRSGRFKKKPKTIGVGPRTSTRKCWCCSYPQLKKTKKGVYYLNASVSLLVNQCIGYGGHFKVHPPFV